MEGKSQLQKALQKMPLLLRLPDHPSIRLCTKLPNVKACLLRGFQAPVVCEASNKSLAKIWMLPIWAHMSVKFYGGEIPHFKEKKKGAEVWVWFSLKNGSCLKAAYKFKMLEAGIRSSNLVLTEMKEWISWPHMWYWCKSWWEVREGVLLYRCNILVDYV